MTLLPDLGGDVRRHRGEQLDQHVDRFIEGGAFGTVITARPLGDGVQQFHEGRDGGVVTPVLEVVRDLVDRAMHRSSNLDVALVDAVVEVDLVVLTQSIDAVEESSAPVDDLVSLVGPVDVVGRRSGEEVEEAQPVGAHGLVVLLGRDEVALGLGHLRCRRVGSCPGRTAA